MFKILYISYDGLTDPLGQSQILAYLSKIADHEIQIDIVSFDKKKVFNVNNSIIKDFIKNKQINWHPLFYTKYPPVLSTIWDIIKGWYKIKILYSKNTYNVVHCRGYIPGIIGLRLKKKYNSKLIFDMRGWWCDEKLESGNWNNPIFKPIYKYFKKKEIKLFKFSDKIISLTQSGKKEILKNEWSTCDKIGVIPTCVDFNNFPEFSIETRNSIRNSLQIPSESKVMIYSGSLGGNYDFKDFLKIFNTFLNRSKTNHIIILSKTPKEYILSEINSTSLNTEKIRIVDSAYRDVHKYLQASDIGLILYNISYSVIGRSPTKLGEYWCSGIPALSLKNIGDLNAIYSNYPKGGILIDSINKKEINSALNELEKEYDKSILREYSKDYFHIDKGVNFYKNIYKELLIR